MTQTQDIFGYLPNDRRGYIGPDNSHAPDTNYWSRMRAAWEHVYTLDVVAFGDPKEVHLPAKRSHWGVERERRER